MDNKINISYWLLITLIILLCIISVSSQFFEIDIFYPLKNFYSLKFVIFTLLIVKIIQKLFLFLINPKIIFKNNKIHFVYFWNSKNKIIDANTIFKLKIVFQTHVGSKNKKTEQILVQVRKQNQPIFDTILVINKNVYTKSENIIDYFEKWTLINNKKYSFEDRGYV